MRSSWTNRVLAGVGALALRLAPRTTAAVRFLVWTAVLLGAALVLANFSYNRGYVLAPIVALGAAYSLHVRRISFPALAIAGKLTSRSRRSAGIATPCCWRKS